MHSPRRIGCPDFLRGQLNRRELLRLGAVGLTGVTLPALLELEARASCRRAKARSVILLYQFGGPSHIDTFDPKPKAPAEIRGEFGTISTRVKGIRICEHLPRMARIADKYALIRTVQHNRTSHNPGAYYSLTGHEPTSDNVTLNASATDFPHPGSIVSYLDRRRRPVPTAVSLPTMIADSPFQTPGQAAGFLGKLHDPLWVLHDPNSPNFNVSELCLPEGLDAKRLSSRMGVMHKLTALSELANSTPTQGMTTYQARAADLLTSTATQRAFALKEENPRLRDRYGRTTYGQSVLLARRLVEAGVRFVTVYYSPGIDGWDTHQDNFHALARSRLPQTDQSVSALIEDLQIRGLLDDTLVYWTGDFGRTPKINAEAGRDHWPYCQTVLMAGGGIRGGQVYGSSDARGAYPKDSPVRPDDITATVFHALGFEPDTMIADQLGRPMPISAGRPISELFS
jgi:hypothetical protein